MYVMLQRCDLGPCCEVFEMTSNGGAKEHQPHRLGHFSLQGQYNNLPYYTNEHGQHMYWLDYGDPDKAVWAVIRRLICNL